MVFCFVQEIFCRTTRKLEHLFFLSRKAQFFFQNLTLGYMTKTLNQIIFFSSTKIRISFSATLGIRIFFLVKNHNPSLEIKWSVPKMPHNPGKQNVELFPVSFPFSSY